MGFINNKDKVGSGIILLFALAYLIATFNIPISQALGNEYFTARTLPLGLSVIAIIVCLIQLFTPVQEANGETISEAIVGFQWRPCLLLTGLMLVYGLTFGYLGFTLATFLFLLVGFVILGERRVLLSIAVSGGVAVFMWSILTQVFDIFLDPGNLYRLLVGG